MEADGKAASLRLHDVMDATYPGKLLAELLEIRGKAIDVDASGVVRPSTLGLQVLLSAAATWKSDAVAFKLVDRSGAFADAVKTLGLSDDQFEHQAVNS